MTEGVGAQLQRLHQAMGDMPLPEGLEGASCSPAVKHLAHLAMHTADNGGTREQWQARVHELVPDVSPALMTEAEQCMHEAGLWPWPHNR